MATLAGKTDRYRPNDPTWQPASYYGGFMPNIVPDMKVAKSPYYPDSVVSNTFAALGPLENRPVGGGKKPLEITVNGGNPALSNIPIPRMRPSFGDPIWTAENGVDPYPASYNVIPATGSNVKVASGMPGPSLDDLLTYAKNLPDKTAANPAVAAATAAGQPVTNVTAAIKPQGRGGLFDLIFGPSKNGLGGLTGLMGGPGAGGIVGMLLDPRNNTPAPAKTGPSGVGTNGYTYVNGQNMGYSDAEKAKRAAQGQAIGDANRKNPNPTYSKSGENNSFMPKSYQNSVRQQTGY